MSLFQIKRQFTGAMLFEGEFGSLRLCVEAAVNACANLTGANLVGANLAGANLARANLGGTNLAGAYLAGANLARANLADAYLAGVNLVGANLAGANLVGTNLTGTYLAGANLAHADLARANLAGADLACALIREGVKLRERGVAKECTRSDGYRFLLLDTQADWRWRVMAGCRFFTLPEAWAHWERTRAGMPLGEETFDILVVFEHHAERVEAAR
jgi:hypothetical protein